MASQPAIALLCLLDDQTISGSWVRALGDNFAISDLRARRKPNSARAALEESLLLLTAALVDLHSSNVSQ
jgi:hypothetical protein